MGKGFEFHPGDALVTKILRSSKFTVAIKREIDRVLWQVHFEPVTEDEYLRVRILYVLSSEDDISHL